MIKYLVIFLIPLVLVLTGCSNYINYEKSIISNIDSNTSNTECKAGEDCNKDIPDQCEQGYIFSQEDCKCIKDQFNCKDLDKQKCESNPNCYSFSRDGTCSCPQCLSYLEHQCLPK